MSNTTSKQIIYNTLLAVSLLGVLVMTMLFLIVSRMNSELVGEIEQAKADLAKQTAWRDFYQWRDGTALGHSKSQQAYPKYYELYPNDSYVGPSLEN